MPTIQIETEDLLNAALQLPRPELEQFVHRLFVLKAREETTLLPEREAELLSKINQALPPSTQHRLNELISKRRSHTISEDELQELIQLTDQVELLDAERLKYLLELSHLRDVSLEDLINQLGLKPEPHD